MMCHAGVVSILDTRLLVCNLAVHAHFTATRKYCIPTTITGETRLTTRVCKHQQKHVRRRLTSRSTFSGCDQCRGRHLARRRSATRKLLVLALIRQGVLTPLGRSRAKRPYIGADTFVLVRQTNLGHTEPAEPQIRLRVGNDKKVCNLLHP